MQSTLSKLGIFISLIFASVASFGQCTVPPCVNQDKQIMGSRWQAYGNDTGTANAYVVTTVASLGPGLRAGSVIIFKAANANTGASTLAVDGLSAIPIMKAGTTALSGGEIAAGQVVTVVYDGTNFQMQSIPTGTGVGGSSTIHTCIFTFGDPGAGSSVLVSDNDGPRECGNDFGTDETIVAVALYVDAGASTFTPILTGGGSTSILTSAITGSAGSWVAGTVNGSPILHSFASDGASCPSTPCTLDANITTADGTTKYAVMKIDTVGSGGTGSTDVGTGGASNHEVLFDDAGLVNGIANSTAGYVLTSNGTGSTPSFQASSGSGTVTTTGTPASGNLTKFSGATSITNGDLSGDVTTSGTLATTVVKINGNSVPSGAASHQVLVATGANTFSLKTVPDCTDTGGNHINYTQSTDAFSCGTSSSGGGGGLTLVEQHTASSSASLDFTTCISSTYDDYEFEEVGIVPSTNNVSWQMQMGNTGTGFDTGANYNYGLLYSGIGDVPTQSTGSGVSAIDLAHSVTTTAHYSSNGTIHLYSPGGSDYKFINGKTQSVATNLYQWGNSGVYLITTAVNEVRFKFSSGNIASGTIRCYGIAK